MRHAAIGFSDHSGWAVAAIVARNGQSFEFVLRQRIQLCPTHLPRQAYHAVAERGAARSIVEQVVAASISMSTEAIGALAAETGSPIRAAAIAQGRTPVPDSMNRILASHALLHAAEGELYRDVLVEAAAGCGLRLVRFLNNEVRSEAAAAIGWPLAALEARLAAIGVLAGRPWTKDEKDATAAAMLALAIAG